MSCHLLCQALTQWGNVVKNYNFILNPTAHQMSPFLLPKLNIFCGLEIWLHQITPLPNWTLLWKTLTMDRDKDPLPPRMWDLTRQGPVWPWPPSSLYMRPHGRGPSFVPLVSLETCSNLFTSGHPPPVLTSGVYWSMYDWRTRVVHILVECFLFDNSSDQFKWRR